MARVLCEVFCFPSTVRCGMQSFPVVLLHVMLFNGLKGSPSPLTPSNPSPFRASCLRCSPTHSLPSTLPRPTPLRRGRRSPNHYRSNSEVANSEAASFVCQCKRRYTSLPFPFYFLKLKPPSLSLSPSIHRTPPHHGLLSYARRPTTTPEEGWKSKGVCVIPGDSLDTNTAQTPGMGPRSSDQLRSRRGTEAMGGDSAYPCWSEDGGTSSWAFGGEFSTKRRCMKGLFGVDLVEHGGRSTEGVGRRADNWYRASSTSSKAKPACAGARSWSIPLRPGRGTSYTCLPTSP